MTVRWERRGEQIHLRATSHATTADSGTARAIAVELGWPARESPADVLAAVEAEVLPQATALSVTRLRALVRRELIKADPAAADRRRKRAERDADVTVRGIGDGMGELRATMPYPEAAAMRAAVRRRDAALSVGVAATPTWVACDPCRSGPNSSPR